MNDTLDIPEWTTACPDWGDRLRRGESIIPPPIFPEAAAQALDIFKSLRIGDAPGSPQFGQSANPWLFDLVSALFGAYDARTGRRHINEVFVLIPKKNSKSTLAAAIMMTALTLNWRRSGEFAILAPTIEVASNAFAPAKDMVDLDEDLSVMMNVQSHVRTITHTEMNSTLKVIAADAKSAAGKKSIGTLIDELWLLGKEINAEDMIREATGGLASRPEGFVIYLTTQSNEPPAGVFKKKLEYARKVRDGKIHDPKFLPVIFEHPDDMVASGEHLLLENMGMVNPNLHVSVDWEFLRSSYQKAKEEGEASFKGFMAKYANVEIGMALRSDNWPGAEFWQQQGDSAVTLDALIEKSEVVTVGIDGGGLDDLLGLSVVGRLSTNLWWSWSRAWAHKSVLERRKNIASMLQDYHAAGDVGMPERLGDDIIELAAIIKRIYDAGILYKIGIDPAGVGSILDVLAAEEIPAELVIGISQGWRLGGAIKTAERKLAEGVIWHAEQGLMTWCVGNAKVEPRGNASLITKQASGQAKIDPLMAFFNAVSLMATNPDKMRKEYAITFF